MTEARKIGFALEKDEVGYPPAENEWLWAGNAEGAWIIDNIPWYSRDVRLGDVVAVDEADQGQLWFWFRSTVEQSGHSTLRVLILDRDSIRTAALRARLKSLGCTSEQSSEARPLLAVDLPMEVDIKTVVDVLAEGETEGAWGWETGPLSEPHRS